MSLFNASYTSRHCLPTQGTPPQPSNYQPIHHLYQFIRGQARAFCNTSPSNSASGSSLGWTDAFHALAATHLRSTRLLRRSTVSPVLHPRPQPKHRNTISRVILRPWRVNFPHTQSPQGHCIPIAYSHRTMSRIQLNIPKEPPNFCHDT